jgi:hypothetical protein
MDHETIQKIAEEIALHLPSYSWTLVAIQIALTLAAAGIGAFLGEYLKTRAKNLATKADFDELKVQLSINTSLVETIKSEVGQRDWIKREWTNLRRIKLEELLNKHHDCEAHLDTLRNKALEGVNYEERNPAREMETIGALYFPEIAKELGEYLVAVGTLRQLSLNLTVEILKSKLDLNARAKLFEKYKSEHFGLWNKLASARKSLMIATRKLLLEIISVNA